MNTNDYLNLALQNIEQQNIEKAKEYFSIYEKSQTNKLLLYLDGADFYKRIKNYKKAIEYYEKFLETDNTKSVVYTITADLYSKLYGSKSLEKQLELYKKAYNLKPDNRLTLHALAFIYEKLGQNNNAKIYYNLLLKNNPTEIDFYNYGMFLIHCGNLYEGHKYLTHRFNIEDINLKYPSSVPKWDFKSDISDKTLLIHYEQGFGDTIMYCRFVPFMKKFAKKIIFVVQKELEDLIKNSIKISEGVEIRTDENCCADYSIAILDLPYVLKTRSETIPYSEGYLHVPTFDKDKNFNIGIAYSGDKNANYNNRDLDINFFKFLTNNENIKVYSLQKDENLHIEGITPLGHTFSDFTDSAKAICKMDLIISTDNVILNLAGALAIRTLGLFNEETNFRWFNTKGESVVWYDSVKPLQAANTQDLKKMIEQNISHL